MHTDEVNLYFMYGALLNNIIASVEKSIFRTDSAEPVYSQIIKRSKTIHFNIQHLTVFIWMLNNIHDIIQNAIRK